MAPNLFLAVKSVLQPKEWFSHHETCLQSDLALTQFRKDPIPGIYEHVPGCGWFLIATQPAASCPATDTEQVSPPQPVVYSKVLKRFLFESDFVTRTRRGRIMEQGRWAKPVGFFRLDDGISWVNCWDDVGEFLKGPWVRYCWDTNEEKFRPMLVGDKRHGENNEEWLATRLAKTRKGSAASSQFSSRAGSLDSRSEGCTVASSRGSRKDSTSSTSLNDTRSHSSDRSSVLVDGNGNLNIKSLSIRSRNLSGRSSMAESMLTVPLGAR